MNIGKENLPVNRGIAKLNLLTRFVGEASDEDIRIEDLIRNRYSLSNELSLHRKKAMGIIDNAEWDEYCAFVEECIAEARREDYEAEHNA